MINSCSYSTNDLVFIKFQIFNEDLSRCLASTKGSKSSFETNMLIQELVLQDRIKYSKRSLAHGSSLDQVEIEKKIFNRRFSRRLESKFVSLRFLF